MQMERPIRPFGIEELKYQLRYCPHKMKQDVDQTPSGQVFYLGMTLPPNCYPNKVKLCFEPRYFGYNMYFADPITVNYHGSNPQLRRLCDGEIILFDCWAQLEDFCLKLPSFG